MINPFDTRPKEVISVRISPALRDLMDQAVAKNGRIESRTDFITQAITHFLRHPPPSKGK